MDFATKANMFILNRTEKKHLLCNRITIFIMNSLYEYLTTMHGVRKYFNRYSYHQYIKYEKHETSRLNKGSVFHDSRCEIYIRFLFYFSTLKKENSPDI